jgi:Resolvase, N terminal domain
VRVGIYARVSTEAQEARGTIGSQLEALRARVTAAGDELVTEFVDDGYSGARLDRPGLDALRDAAEAGRIEAVWCLSPDRLGGRAGGPGQHRVQPAPDRARHVLAAPAGALRALRGQAGLPPGPAGARAGSLLPVSPSRPGTRRRGGPPRHRTAHQGRRAGRLRLRPGPGPAGPARAAGRRGGCGHGAGPGPRRRAALHPAGPPGPPRRGRAGRTPPPGRPLPGRGDRSRRAGPPGRRAPVPPASISTTSARP